MYSPAWICFELPQGGACISPLITEPVTNAEGVACPLNDSREVATIYLSFISFMIFDYLMVCN